MRWVNTPVGAAIPSITCAHHRLAEELRVLHGAGSFGKWLLQLAKTDVLILDDWALAPLDAATRADLLEVIDDRTGTRGTIITSQLPVEHWHSWIGDVTIADAMLDRLLQRTHRITLKGESLRRSKEKPSGDQESSPAAANP